MNPSRTKELEIEYYSLQAKLRFLRSVIEAENQQTYYRKDLVAYKNIIKEISETVIAINEIRLELTSLPFSRNKESNKSSSSR